MRARLPFLTLALAHILAAPATRADHDPTAPPREARADAPRTERPMRFIVRLAPAGPARAATPDERLARRGACRAAQDDALDRIARALARRDRPRVHRRYADVMNGFAIELLPGDVRTVRRLPGVLDVMPDHEVHALLRDSVPRIGATAAWTDPGVRGDGVVIAVIDTGVDYHHPDLGGGIGRARKVLGGWDFVNDDDDPDDDHGHGTHVAATAAGSGELSGVAPGASLLAYKVLDERGIGSTSDIIAAVERALDPDGDPRTDDRADVITLSLGRGGGFLGITPVTASSDDADALALDAAVEAGAVVTVAAGNEGEYLAITSPGTSRKALTIGAATDDDEVASFSSRGLVRAALLKPDLSAPGVDVCAAWPLDAPLEEPSCAGAAHASLQGTSMATPHAAGAAALVRAHRPGLSAEAVQAVLAETAVPMTEDPLAAGAGRLDVLHALRAEAHVLPSQAAFPRVDHCDGRYVAQVDLAVTNRAAAEHVVTWRLEPHGDPLPFAIDLPATIGALATATMRLTLDVPTTELALRTEGPHGHVGHLVVTVGPDELRVPYLVPAYAEIELDLGRSDSAKQVLVHDGRRTLFMDWALFGDLPSPYAFVAQASPFDAIVVHAQPDVLVVRERVAVEACDQVLDMSPEAATIPIRRQLVARDGSPIDRAQLDSGAWAIHQDGWYYPLSFESAFEAISPVSERTRIELALMAEAPAGEQAFMSEGLTALTGGAVARAVRAEDWASLDVTWDPPAGREAPYLFTVPTVTDDEGRVHDTFESTLSSQPLTTAPPVRRLNLLRPSPGGGAARPRLEARAADVGGWPEATDWAVGPMLGARADGTIEGVLPPLPTFWGGHPGQHARTPVLTQRTPRADALSLDLAPPLWFGRLIGYGDDLYLWSAWGFHAPLFLTQSGAMLLGQEYRYELEDGAGVREGTLPRGGLSGARSRPHFDVEPGPVTFTIEGPAYGVGGTTGLARVRVVTDTSAYRERGQAPVLAGPWIVDDGGPANHLGGCPTADPDDLVVIAALADDAPIVEKRLAVVSTSGARRDLALQPWTDGLLAARLPLLPDAGPWSIAATVRDAAGHVVEVSIDPAFTYTAPPATALALLRVTKADEEAVRIAWDGAPSAWVERTHRLPFIPDAVLAPRRPGEVLDADAPALAYYRLGSADEDCD